MKRLITVLSLVFLLAGASAFSNVESVEEEEPFWQTTTLNGQQIWFCSDANFRNYVVPILNTYGYWVDSAEDCAADYEIVSNDLIKAENHIEGLETWRTVLGITSIFLILGNIGGVFLW